MSQLEFSKEKSISTSKKINLSKINSSDDKKTKDFKTIINLYLENLNTFQENHIPELEVRFGTKKIKSLSKINIYNVIKSLLNNGFKLNSENYFLKIIPDSKELNIRTQISGFPNIQYYCKNNNITNIEDPANIEFVDKDYFIKKGEKTYPVDFDDFNFRISYQVEKKYNISHKNIEDLLSKWNTTKKIFRYIKRYEYIHPNLPFLIHCSIVKTSKTKDGNFISQYNIKDSEVFDSLEHFEIEIEVNNIAIQSNYNSKKDLYTDLKTTIKYVLIGIQETNFPIQISQQNSVLNNYLSLIKNKDIINTDKPNSKDFIGPSSVTLQMINLLNESDINDTNKNIPNIRNNYTVTDKADGFRKLLFINTDGYIYLISSTMNVEFTGCITKNKDIFNTIIDGEHILHNKKNEYINLFAAFDIYFINGKNITSINFTSLDDDEKKDEDSKNNRLSYLHSAIKVLDLNSVISGKKLHFNIISKKFYRNNIFQACNLILDNVDNGLYQYNTDGLIFTPANTGVVSNKTGVIAPNFKTTWKESFKWKPPEYNTIDFLVKIKKNDYGNNLVGNLYNEGIDMTNQKKITNFYTLLLHVGFNEKQHGYINPFNDIINDNINKDFNEKYHDEYKPALFYPTNPSDNTAHICNIIGKLDDSNMLKIYTEDGEEIEDNTIVEFKYDKSKKSLWNWVPIKVRYDKTSELRSGIKNFGNAYHVANQNWQTIFNPITLEIIKTGKPIKIDNGDDDIYYNKVDNKTETRALRDYHNLYVKNLLISKISKPGYTLIDYACGKGGDIPKWINNKLDFVLGIDLSKDNISNRLDGACARYLNYSKKYSIIPKCIFIPGNSSMNIKSGNAFNTEKEQLIIKSLFGEGEKNEIILGRGVYKNYGIVNNGFNISSIQFALHYMFENEVVLHEFLKNISECTAVNGYFIGSCYNGKKVFNMLNDIELDKSISLYKNDKKIWEITRRYSSMVYNDNESCLSYAIDIYQESINKSFREYLVNFEYLTRLMENYGFVLLSREEYLALELPGSIGGFEELYKNMNLECERRPYLKNKYGNSFNMSEEEKKISFLNNYFVYKKVRNVNESHKNPDDIISDKKINEELIDLDKALDIMSKKSIEEESKKISEKINKLEEKVDSEKADEEKGDEEKIAQSKHKAKLTIDEKLLLAEKKKEEKAALKLKEKEEKAAIKLKEKEEKAAIKLKEKQDKAASKIKK